MCLARDRLGAMTRSASVSGRRPRGSRRVAVAALLFSGLAVSCSAYGDADLRPPDTTSAATAAASDLPLIGDLGQRDVDLRAGPVVEPIELRIPAIGVDAEVLGVGMTADAVMDAPGGPADAAAWQQAFWYRGSAIPGDTSTALLAGHVNDPLSRPGVFARLDELTAGDEITVHDTRTGLDVRFTVTETRSVTLAEAAEPDVLDVMYGAGPVQGSWPVPSADGLAHLTLVTCAGTYRAGTHDHRLLVQAVRSP